MLAVLVPVVGIALLAATAHHPNQAQMSRASFEERGLTWPLIPDGGKLECVDNNWLIFTPDGTNTNYSVNGLAKGTGAFNDLDAIWADDPNVEGLKVSAGDLTEEGLALCP